MRHYTMAGSLTAPTDQDFIMETICAELNNEIGPSLLDDIDLCLECDDDDVNFSVPVAKDNKNVTFKVSFYPASKSEETSSHKTFTCHICKEEYNMETKFKYHMTSCHCNDKPFFCNICSYRSASLKLMKQHFIKVHKRKVEATESFTNPVINRNEDIPSVKYVCSQCPFSASNEKELKSHFSKSHDTDTSDKLLSCHQCDYTCKQKKTFSLHMKKHNGAAVEQICEMCGKQFLTMTQFNRHYKTHREARPFSCTISGCQKSFKLQGSLTEHIRTVHSEEQSCSVIN